MARLYIGGPNQSNGYLRGAGENASINPLLLGPMPLAKIYDGTDTLATFEVGVNNQYPTNTPFHSALPAFLKAEIARLNETIYVCGYGWGDTAMADNGIAYPTDFYWRTWYPSKSGALTDRLISTVNHTISIMWNTHGVREIDFYIFPGQGESDCALLADANAWGANSRDFITKLEANLSGTAFANSKKRWFWEKIGTDTTYNATNLGIINTAMQAIVDDAVAGYSGRMLIDDPAGDGLQGDGHHRTAPGYKAQGERKSAAMAAAGW